MPTPNAHILGTFDSDESERLAGQHFVSAIANGVLHHVTVYCPVDECSYFSFCDCDKSLWPIELAD